LASSQPEKPPEAKSMREILAAAAAVVSGKVFSTNILHGLEKRKNDLVAAPSNAKQSV